MQIKGTAVRSILLGLEKVGGTAGVARVKAALTSEIRSQIEPIVLASRYYPVAVSAALQDAIRSELGAGSCTINHRVGAEAARIDFGGVYTVFLRALDYETTLRRLDRAWRQYNSRGEVVWPEIGRTLARGEIRGVESFTEPMWYSIAGRVQTILLLAGAKKASVTVTSWTSEGCMLDLQWVR